jgi:hypothetical protein
LNLSLYHEVIKVMSNQTSRTRKGKRRSQGNKEHVAKFAGDAYSLAERAYRGVSHLAKLINIETKTREFVKNNETLSNTPAIYLASGFAIGTDADQRVGFSIKLQHLSVRMNAYIGTTTTTCQCRATLVRDLENQGADPVFGDVFDSNYSNSIAPPQEINEKRFSILFDECWVIQPLSFQGLTKFVDIPHNGHIRFRTNGTTSASQAEGALYLILWTSATSNFPTVNIGVRMRYTDD